MNESMPKMFDHVTDIVKDDLEVSIKKGSKLQLAYEGDSSLINSKLNTSRSIEDVFKNAQMLKN